MEIIVAVSSITQAEQLKGQVRTIKVGLPLIAEMGLLAADSVHNMGFQVLYDIKMCDILYEAMKATMRIVQSDAVWGMTAHASGGRAMLTGIKDTAGPVKVFGVLKLSSLLTNGQEIEEAIDTCRAAKLDGTITTLREIRQVRNRWPLGIHICTAIRPYGNQRNDHARIGTYIEASEGLTDAIIVGRRIAQAANPLKALKEVQIECRAR